MRRRPGTHVIAELFDCNETSLDDIIFIRRAFLNAIKNSGLILIRGGLKIHKFNPQGVTAIALLTSSHISFHSWPQFKYACIDIFACDEEEKVKEAFKIFIDFFKPKRVKKIILKRGYIVRE